MSIEPAEGKVRLQLRNRIPPLERSNGIDRDGSKENHVLRDLTRFVEDSDLSIPRIAKLLRVSDVILSMWIARTAKASKEKLAEIELFLRSSVGGVQNGFLKESAFRLARDCRGTADQKLGD